jgi:hypothetical protein
MASSCPGFRSVRPANHEMTPNPIEGYMWADVSYDPRSVKIASADGSYTVKAKNEITKVNGDGSLKIVKDLSNPNDATVPETFRGRLRVRSR